MASNTLLMVHLLSLLVGYSCLNVGEGDDRNYHVITIESLMPKKVCSTPKGSKLPSASLLVAHRYGPCSPVPSTKQPTLLEVLRRDKLRADYLRRRILNGSAGAQVQDSELSLPAHRGDEFGILNYVVTVAYGTPTREQTVSFDTGSDLNWIQCEPCSDCYQQQQPVFDPSQSTSYSNVSCDSPDCTKFSPHKCFDSTCGYAAGYGDGSFTVGLLARETLTLAPGTAFTNFVFGCGHDNEGLFRGIAGLLGLGRGQVSTVSQISQKFGEVFSYCLPPTSSSTGYLNFGSAAPGAISYTPMLTSNLRPTLYSISLTGISVQGKQLPISPSVFSSVPTFIDSGTVISRLPPSAYEALKSDFKSYMSAYPPAPAQGILDTCFDFSGSNNISAPTVALNFGGGATIDLGVVGTLVPSSDSQACLAFTADDSIGIVGNVQQRTFEVVYDIGMQRIGFAPSAC